MTRKFLSPTLPILLLASLLLTACGRDEADPPAFTAPDAATADLFDRIDADSPYVMANLSPLPDDMARLLWQPLQDAHEFNQLTYGQAAEEMRDRAPLIAAILEELSRIDSMEALEARGLHGNGQWAIHGLSLYPVMHWQLTDAEVFAATLERLAIEGQTELPRRSIDGQELLWIDGGQFGLALHHDEDFLTIALVPDDPALLRRVANLDAPQHAYDPADLQAFNRAQGFEPFGSGYIDLVALAGRLLDPAEPVPGDDGRLQALAGDEACRTEIAALTAHFPRINTGVARLDREAMTFRTRIQTESALGQRLSTIANTPVSLSGDDGGVMSAGLAFNLVAARDFARDLVAGWVDNPPQCELFADIRDQAANWQLALNRPIPPFITNIHGFRLNLDRLVMRDRSSVEEAEGTAALFMRNPQMLLGMAQMFSPELAALNLRPGGTPQPLPQGMLPGLEGLPAFLAMSDGAIGLAVGDGHAARLDQALRSAGADSAIFAYSIDMAAYGQWVKGLVEAAAADQNETEMPPMDFFDRLGETYQESRFSIHLEPQGIDLVQTLKLRQ